MTKRQKGKHHKRQKSWHRAAVARRNLRAPLPPTGVEPDPSLISGTPVKYGPGKRIRTKDILP